jgi:large subunit ribosomal protein L10
MKNRDEKKKDYEALRKALEKAESLFVTGFNKLTVDQDYNLRKTIRGAGGNYRVVKNNIAEIAAEGTAAEQVLKGLKGMSALTIASDPVSVAKALTAYAKANPAFTFKAGMVEGRAIDIGAIGDLATMPSKEEIFAKLLYLINAPAQRLLGAINGTGRNLAVVIDRGVAENKFQG